MLTIFVSHVLRRMTLKDQKPSKDVIQEFSGAPITSSTVALAL